MGIYGFGKAFNIRYAQNSYRPTMRFCSGPKPPIGFGHQSYTENTTIKINNGPTGFWGFMSGLFGGLFGGGMGVGMGMNMGSFGVLNTQMAQPAIGQAKTGDRLADLQKMFPNWVITSDGNGNYDAVNKDQTVHHKGNFDEMCDKLLKEKQGTSSTEETSTTTTQDTSTAQKSTPETKTPASDGNGAVGGGGGKVRSRQGAGGAAKTTKKSIGVKVPNNWYRADTNSQEGKGLNLKSCTSASAVMNKLLSAKVDYLSSSDKAQLTKELIKNNPSVFDSNGKVKAGANFDKLDVPSIAYIKNKYVGKAKYNKNNGTVTYTSKQGNGTNIGDQNSTMKGAGGKVIRGNNGYFVRVSKSGNVYYDPKGNQISKETFAKKCPNIYASLNKAAASTKAKSHPTPANNGHTHTGSRQPWL